MVDEIRLRAIKHAIHDAPHDGGAALDVEVLFGRLPGNYENSILNYFLTPRLHVGSLVSFGKTDEYYWGATWDLKLFDRVFFESSFGGAAHDGPLDHLGWASYGCRVNFRESASLGYALTREWRVMAEVDHMSNAGLCDSNRGLTNAGLRLGYKF
jgi:cob(I)alamin adenosyltransferase